MKNFDADFNPEEVPRWPNYTIEVRGSGNPTRYRAEIGGRSIPLADEVNDLDSYAVSEAAVDHVVQLIAERQLHTCRVTAVDADGRRWPMILGAEGQRHSLVADSGEDNTAAMAAPSRRSWPIYAIAALITAAVATGGIYAVTQANQPAPIATPSGGPYVPVPAELPVPAPAGWSTHATWASPATNGQAVVANDLVWTIIENELVTLDVHTGQPRGRWDARGQRGPWLATVNGTTLIVTSSTSGLTWRDASKPATSSSATVEGNLNVTASPAGLWWTSGNDAWVLTADGPARRTIPAGATITTANGDALIATDTLGRVWTLSSDQIQTPEPGSLTPPRRAAALRGILAADNTTIAAVWELADNGGSVLSFHSLDGKIVAPSIALDHAGTSVVDRTNHRYLVTASIAADLTQRTAVMLPAGTRIDQTVDSLAFGAINGVTSTIDLATGKQLYQQATVTTPAQPTALVGKDLLVTDPSTRKLYLIEP